MKYNKEILKLERKLASLRSRSAKADAKKKKTAFRNVTSLLKKFGFDSIHELLEIADTAVVASSTKRKRAKIDDATRKAVVAVLKSGKTAAEVAKIHKISTATVNNIKKAAGLTKSKKIARFIKQIHRTTKPKAPKKIAKQVLRRAEPRAGKVKTAAKQVAKRIYGPKGVIALVEPAKEAPTAV
jgi:hypothetical protein